MTSPTRLVPTAKLEQRYHVTAAIEVHCPPGLEFKLADIDLVKQGSFRDANGPFALTLGGTLGEIRKLALASDSLHQLVLSAESEPDDAAAVIHLEASPRQLADMAEAARSSATEPTPDELLENSAWMRAALSFHEYEPRHLEVLPDAPWSDPS